MKPWLSKGDDMDISAPNRETSSHAKGKSSEGEYVDYEEVD